MRFCLLLIAATISVPAIAQEQLPALLYFTPTWCPRPEELAMLSKFMNIRHNGCCIRQALVFSEYRSHPELLAPWRDYISATNTFDSECTGRVLTEQEEQLQQTEALRKEEAEAAEAAEAEQAEAAEAAEQQRVAARSAAEAEAAKRKDVPRILTVLSRNDFCQAYGMALRNESVPGIGAYPELTGLVKAEAARRGLRFEGKLVLEHIIKLGLSECQLYASWGFPESQNRSVGQWGVHIQHVYRSNGTNVYTENGFVTAWQD